VRLLAVGEEFVHHLAQDRLRLLVREPAGSVLRIDSGDAGSRVGFRLRDSLLSVVSGGLELPTETARAAAQCGAATLPGAARS